MWTWVRAKRPIVVNTAAYGRAANLSTAAPEIVKAL